MKVFKILDTKTGLFSTGGYAPGWTREGKSYKTLPQVKTALKLYERGSAYWPLNAKQKEIEERKQEARRTIPTSWRVVEFRLAPKTSMSARSVLKS